MKSKKETIAIYSRKSKYTGKGESIGNQVELCKEYIQIHYGEEALNDIEVFEDEGFSGGNLNRPDFKKMMDAAKKHSFKAIIVYRLDRISRNISDFSGLIEELFRLDIAFISIREQFDTSTPMGRAMMYIASVFSQLERETIAERIRDNMHELAKTGRWLGGTTPTGYASEAVQTVSVDGKTKKACQLKLVPEEAEIIRLIFDLYTEKKSLTITEAELLKRGLKTKTGRDFTRFSLKSILENPVYMIADADAYHYLTNMNADLFSAKEEFDGTHGIMAYNRTDQERGRSTKYLPPSEWIVTVGAHPGIIPGRVWVAVQESLEQNKKKSFNRPRINEGLLTGILYCTCGNRMYPKLSHRKDIGGKPIHTYVCMMKMRSKKELCNSKNINGMVLDQAVIDQIKNLNSDESTFVQQLECSRKFYVGNSGYYKELLISMQKEQSEIEKKIEGLIDSMAELEKGAARDLVAKRIEKLNKNLENINIQIKEQEALISRQSLSDSEFDMMIELLTKFQNGIDQMTVEQKRAAIRTIVRKIVWDGTNAHIILFGANDADIDYPKLPVKNDISDISDASKEVEGKSTLPKTPCREDSKRNFNAAQGRKEIYKRDIPL